MGDTTIDPKALEDAMLKALPSLFPNLLGTAGSNPRVEFYEKFGREAEDHDREFTDKYDDDLDTTLIFAGLFSAVATGFIVDAQQNLQPNYQQMGYTVLEIIANSSLGRISASDAPDFPRWDGPDPAIAHVLAILYSSLASSLLAAFIAMLGKQWLNRCGRTETHGSPMDRSRDRQRKINGMVNWRFALVMECLPLMLQAALLLLGYALSQYLFSIDKTVASVTTGFTSFGLLFYFFIVAAATFSYSCPFQTPLSRILRSLIRFYDEHKKYLKRTRQWFGWISPWKKRRPRSEPGGPVALNQLALSGIDDHIELPIAIPSDRLPPFFDKADAGGYVLDSKCIAWMFEKSTDADVVMAIMRFIPEVIWHADIRTTPLERLYDTVLECFDHSSGRPVVSSRFKNKAYFSARALLHVVIQRKCIGNASDEDVFKSISDRHLTMGSGHDEELHADLESTLGIVDRIFAGDRNYNILPWQNFSFTITHHTWMGHILLYRAWDAIVNKGEPLPDDVKGFIHYSLRLEPLPPVAVVMNCLAIICLVLGLRINVVYLQFVNIRRKAELQIDKIYKKLTDTFKHPTPTADEIDCALEAMKLITHLSDDKVAQNSYNLFRIVMQAPTSTTYTEEKKWEAARLAMHGAYKSDEFLPPVESPRDILAFLTYQFDVTAGGGQYQDEPIQDALRALAHASIESLERFDPTQPQFLIDGIRYVYEFSWKFQLRKAAFFFLPLISDKWFDTPDPIMGPDEMKRFCADWASTMDEIGNTDDVKKAGLTVLFGMINSPHWRPHIMTEKWELLDSFDLIPEDSRPFKKCIDNPDLMDAIKDMGNAVATALWLKILWLKFGEIIPEVRKRLVTFTKEVARSGRKGLSECQAAVDSELVTAVHELTQHSKLSQDPVALALRTKVENLQLAYTTLANINSG